MIIYLITNKINGKQYIGQTNRSIKERFSEHCKPCKKNISALSLAIQKYGKENFIITKLQKCLDLNELNKLEQYFIQLYNTLSPNGYNLTTGGNKFERSKESIEKSKIKRQFQKAPIPKGSKQTKEWIDKRIEHKKKSVIGINIKTNEIIEFESCTDAQKFIGKPKSSLISSVCLGKRKQSYGYFWKYKTLDNERVNNK